MVESEEDNFEKSTTEIETLSHKIKQIENLNETLRTPGPGLWVQSKAWTNSKKPHLEITEIMTVRCSKNRTFTITPECLNMLNSGNFGIFDPDKFY